MNSVVKKINDYNKLSQKQSALFALFETMAIPYETYEHPAIFTVEAGKELNLPEKIPGQHGKSLFLKNAADEIWLIVVCENKRVDLKNLHKILGTKRFSFASPALMLEILGVTPGSVTPFALINDTDKRVRLVIDSDFTQKKNCVFHPVANTHSTVIAFTDLLRFFDSLGFHPHMMPLG